MQVTVSYASVETNAMIETAPASLPGRELRFRRSEDNGKTWQRIEEQWPGPERLDNQHNLTRTPPGFWLDEKTGRLARAYSECVVRKTSDAQVQWLPAATTRKNFMQYSDDQGQSWSEPEQLVVAGDEFDETHWAPQVTYGENGGVGMWDSAFTQPDGTIVLPFTTWRRPDPDERRYLGRFAYLVLHDEERGAWERRVTALLGAWREGGAGVVWEMGDYVRVDGRRSLDGACEPGICRLPDGRLFMIIRTRAFPDSDVEIPGAKLYAVSEDAGRTWSEARMLRYEDRDPVYAPASFSRVFTSTKNGRAYLITNISDVPCYGCDPRSKLQIAEINRETLRVIRESVTVIEQRQEDQQETIRFSNFAWHEDRETGNMIIYMAPAPGPTGSWAEGNMKDTARSPGLGVPPHCYRYAIILPE